MLISLLQTTYWLPPARSLLLSLAEKFPQEEVWGQWRHTLEQLDQPGKKAGPVAAPKSLFRELLQWQHKDQESLPTGAGMQPEGHQQCLKEFLERCFFPIIREGQSGRSSSNGAVASCSHQTFCHVPLQKGERPGQLFAADLCTLDCEQLWRGHLRVVDSGVGFRQEEEGDMASPERGSRRGSGGPEVLALSLPVAELMVLQQLGQGDQERSAVKAGLELLGLLGKPVGLGCLFGGSAFRAVPANGDGEARYRPAVISLYRGKDGFGHYTTAVRCPQGGQWYHLDDMYRSKVGSWADFISHCRDHHWIPEVVWCLADC
jgi:hypothetical protein